MASKIVACGPVQNDCENLLNSSLQKTSRATKSMSCGPVQHNYNKKRSSSLQKRRMASKSVFLALCSMTLSSTWVFFLETTSPSWNPRMNNPLRAAHSSIKLHLQGALKRD